MRMVTALVLVCLVSSAPAAMAETLVEKIKGAAVGGAAGKGVEFAIKLVGGMIYNTACPPRLPSEKEAQFLCDVLGSVSGSSEKEWKDKVDAQLTRINSQLTQIDTNVKNLQNSINANHKEIEAQFNQAAVNVVATKVTVRIDNLWGRYQQQIAGAQNLDRQTMIDFAEEVMKQELHTKLGDLNVVLTQPQLDSKSILRFPYHLWMMRPGNNPATLPRMNFEPAKIYDYAEKKFLYFRNEQQKAYLIYLWAAEILEAQCEMKPETCATSKPPVKSKVFKEIFDRYTREQIAEFNAATEWFLLSYAYPHDPEERFLPSFANPGLVENILLRANVLSLNQLGGGEGLWGRVISMGNQWDGSLEVQCGSVKKVLKPVLTYTTPVADRFGTLDWWVSRNADRVYNEVRFSADWKVHHYHLAEAPAGKCTVNATLPNRGGMLPWIEPGTEVVAMPAVTKDKDDRDYTVGSFIALQRAGGAYALNSGAWKQRSWPYHEISGTADQVDLRNNWKIQTNRPGGPYMGIWGSGRGKYVTFKGSRVHNYDQLYIYTEKDIFFPNDSTARLNLAQSSDCLDLCDGQSDHLLVYNIENDSSDKGKGSLQAHVAVFLDSKVGSHAHLSVAQKNRTTLALDNGIHIDGSYSNAGDTKTWSTTGSSRSGNVQITPGTAYKLHYFIEFDLETEGRGIDSTRWSYQAKITPWKLYLTQQ